ncbi:YtxH domain-containing protein [Chitinophaga pendula]|uniref:YtxH domain-containing protein n=1 Tax=Chitinophaga TaxID=79328 RepID=UPI000BAF9576|nr:MULTISPECIES: YtxH domain-containing protein [Chitinophaga]ASZ10439.1 hypothetical protein CK934_05330 [Chitinophaga sp. MD30]UCJ06592.1 YtxH domain-containing protein [Chitinophaga pendula]
MENNSNSFFTFIAGAAVGAAVCYFLHTDKKDELINKVKYHADRLKNKIKEGKQQVEEAIDQNLS